ncbi:hypothetical protein EDM59_10040 [Brevibacillus nitrificans]|uniref:Peptidase M3A and M3B thimet/oligopeptidase F n=1 Tax=Brevibacillus nitrificans TaxID=651560 RepID=A0A3M8DEV4_9BACL|nr:hypothetical protein [Brevibacillus nitrificans]RNB86518.1 hypothetical protein EDM59_10040 [Brevibacillus nitrificans]
MDLDRLARIQEEEAWKAAYDEEIGKLEMTFQELTLLQYELTTEKIESPRLNEIQQAHFQIFTDPRFTEMLDFWEQRISDPKWKRRLSVLKNKALQEEIESHPAIASIKNSLMSTILQKTFTLHGETYSLSNVQAYLMMNPDRPLREDLFMETVRYGKETASQFRELVLARNRYAQEKGYSTYFHFVFEHIYGLDWEMYREQGMQMLQQTDAISRVWESRFKEKFGWEDVRYHDLLFGALNYYDLPAEAFPSEKINEVLALTCASFGVELSSTPIQVTLCDLPYGGMMNAISPTDIRIAVRKRDGYGAYKIALHEMGHALYEHFSSQQPPELFRFKDLIGHEAMAEIFMTISAQPKWLQDVFHVEDSVIKQTQEYDHLFFLMVTKYYFYQSLLEHAIYENPEADFQELSDKWAEEAFGVKGRAMSPSVDVLYLAYPVYTHSYIFADGIRDMLRKAFRVDGLYGNQHVFDAIRQSFMEPSESEPWQEKLQALCKEPFTFQYFADYLVGKSHFQ